MTLDYVLVHDMSAPSARFQLYLPSGGSQEMVGGGEGREKRNHLCNLEKTSEGLFQGRNLNFQRNPHLRLVNHKYK